MPFTVLRNAHSKADAPTLVYAYGGHVLFLGESHGKWHHFPENVVHVLYHVLYLVVLSLGFGIPLLPSYNASVGAAWLERGGRYVECCLRGGGEFGSRWEVAGRGAAGRLRAYEDLKAVVDAVRSQLGTGGVALMGRSNGGLMVANEVVRVRLGMALGNCHML